MKKDNHETYNRLREMAGDFSAAEIGRLIGESDQTMVNWRTRGVPRAKHVTIAMRFGGDPTYLATGKRGAGPAASMLAKKMFALKCPVCSEIHLHTFIELELNDALPCPNGHDVIVADYYPLAALDTILKNLGGPGFQLRKR